MLFLGQYSDEKVISMLRRHWTVLLFKVLSILVFGLGLLIIFLIVSQGFLSFIWGDPYINLLIFAMTVYLLLVWIYLFLVWTDYYLDVWIVTDHRIIDIVQTGLFNREFSEFKLSRIQDITVEVKGFIPTMLGYGNVHIQTAGERQNFVFLEIPKPYEVKDIILREYDNFMAKYVSHKHQTSHNTQHKT